MNFIRANFRHYCIHQFYPEKNANEWFSHAALNSSNACFENSALLLGPLSANPFTNIRRTVRDSAVIYFETRQKCDYVALDEPDFFQIENNLLIAVTRFEQPF